MSVKVDFNKEKKKVQKADLDKMNRLNAAEDKAVGTGFSMTINQSNKATIP
jgi:hypothetical protein